MKTTKGVARAVCATTKPKSVPVSRRRSNTRNIAIASAICGTITGPSDQQIDNTAPGEAAAHQSQGHQRADQRGGDRGDQHGLTLNRVAPIQSASLK